MKTTSPLWIAALVLVGAGTSARAAIPYATDRFLRHDKFEAYGIGEYLHQDDISFPGVKVKMNDTGLGGIGMAWHFSDYFSAHADFLMGPATFHGQPNSGTPYDIGEGALLQPTRFNLDYNIINRRLTPYLTAGLGYQYFEIDQSYHSGNYYYYNYYSEFDFSWNVGAGIRWNITDNLFIKAAGQVQWVLYQDAQNPTAQIGASFAIGVTLP
jgi:opacity protein-like surface antigen